jgi:hypothetical protein
VATWVTKKHIKVNRAATSWLIHRFIDPEAEILFVEPEEVDHETVERAGFLYDALYASLRQRIAQERT